MINSELLPLYLLFDDLRRRQGFIIGIDDYLEAIKLLEEGVAVGSFTELKQVCSWLWAKSPEQIDIIHQRCDRIQKKYGDKIRITEAQTGQKQTEEKPSEGDGEKPPPLPPRRPLLSSTIIEKDYNLMPDQDLNEYAQAVKLSEERQDDTPDGQPPLQFSREYFPVNQRQMKQSWRSLRRLVREGTPVELDVEGTINKISHEGILSEPVLQPPRINRTYLILLIDQGGSMVPFHILTRQLAETARRGGKLRKIDVFFFHNCVGDYLFQQPSLFDRKSYAKFLADLDNRAVALIISDGGAARESKDRDRVERTKKFIQELKAKVRYCAWLNPMPSDTWPNTSAALISEYIPMFSMNRQGLNRAIAVLRGKYQKGEALP